MPVITFEYQDYITLLGYKISKIELLEKLPMIGADLDKVEGDTISIEFFPDRPDLASVEGIARASRAFFDFEPGMKQYPLQPSDIVTHVDPSVKEVRPFIATALVKQVTMTDELIASLMDMQEKLHFGIGRNRKKVAIGVHNYEPVEPPFTYKAVDPDAVEFVPLAKVESMTLTEILQQHEKGVAYAHLLQDYKKHPLIVDKNNNVLSYPPIINGSLTEVTPFTKELFIDVTGTDRKAIHHTINIITTALAERGGQIETTTVKDGKETLTFPNLTPPIRDLSIAYVNKVLGTQLGSKEITTCLGKMEYNAVSPSNDILAVSVPPWRSDILHEIDLVEDVAIGYGFDQFKPGFPSALTSGRSLPHQHLHDALRTIMVGLGFNEVTTFALSNENDEFTKLGLDHKRRVELLNPIGEDISCVRVGLLSSLLKILSENRHHSLPQQIFEVGVVVDEQFTNSYHLAGVKIAAKAHFTECKSLVEAVLRDSGTSPYHIAEKEHPAFIEGRCASVTVKDRELGFFGELHPRTIRAFNLEYPIIAFDLQAKGLGQ
jgi:phenylalanyl-tRNA synthetase beta chain